MQNFTKWQSVLTVSFFLIYFILGALLFRDYGLTWDDPLARNIGLTTYEYITGTSSKMLTYADRDYGPTFELFLVFVEKRLGVSSPHEVIYLRHFLTFLLFFTSIIFFYKLAIKRFGWLLAFLGTIFLILSPRIFADSFYNTKDMAPFAAMIIATYTMVYFLEKTNIKRAVVHALACAFLVDVRLPGLIVVILTVGFFLFDAFIFAKNRREWRRNLKTLGIYLGLFLLLTIFFWPYLWINPAGHFLQALGNMTRFLRWDDTVWYFGKFVKAAHALPWHYSLVWIGITTPIVYISLFLLGSITVIWRYIKRPIISYKKYRDDLIFLSWFAIPIVSVIAFRSILYDGWRHLYFIYPALILLALVGLEGVLEWSRKFKDKRKIFLGALVALVSINAIPVMFFMVMYHPYQNLYFNALVGGMENAKKNFELDYWGLTFKKGLEYIAATDKDSQISVFFSHGHMSNIDVLPDRDRKRFIPLDRPEGAKYILTNYRWHPQEYEGDYKKVYEVVIDGTTVMSVIKFY